MIMGKTGWGIKLARASNAPPEMVVRKKLIGKSNAQPQYPLASRNPKGP